MSLKLTNREGNEIHRFDSIAEMDAYTNPEYLTEYTNNFEFLGRRFRNVEEFQESLKQEWREGQLIMADFIDRLEKADLPDIKSLKVKRTYNADGEGEMDFERMMAGDPNYYCKTEKETTDGPGEVTVVIDTTTPGFKDASEVLWRGAAAVALVKILEEKGYKTEIWVVNGSTLYANHPSRGVMTACRLKIPGEPLDISTLINTVSGWFYRAENFALLRTICEKEDQTPNGGLGAAYTPTEVDLDLITMDEKRIYSAGVFSFNGALALMMTEVEKIANREE